LSTENDDLVPKVEKLLDSHLVDDAEAGSLVRAIAQTQNSHDVPLRYQ
jgi:hypothetical protein